MDIARKPRRISRSRLAVAIFIIAFAVGFSSMLATTVVVCLVISFVLLAPSIVLGYAVKAAEREDLENNF